MPEAIRRKKLVEHISHTDIIIAHVADYKGDLANAKSMLKLAPNAKVIRDGELSPLDNPYQNKNVMVMLPCSNFGQHIASITDQLIDLAMLAPSSIALGASEHGIGYVIPNVKVDHLVKLVELQEELKHAESVNQLLKDYFIGPDKKVPLGSPQSNQTNNTQVTHSIYLNSLHVLLDLLVKEDLHQSAICLPIGSVEV